MTPDELIATYKRLYQHLTDENIVDYFFCIIELGKLGYVLSEDRSDWIGPDENAQPN